MAFYSLSEAEQHIMDYMWAHADQEEIHLNEIMEYMETKGYVWKQQTAYSFVIRLKNKKILSSTKRGKRRYYSVNMSRKEFIAKGVQEYLNLAYDGSLLVFLRSLEGDHGLSEEHKQELQQFVKEQQEKEEEIPNLKNGLNFARKVLATGECDVLILDEVLGLPEREIATLEELHSLLEAAENTDLIFTGIRLYPEMLEWADEVYEISVLKESE